MQPRVFGRLAALIVATLIGRDVSAQSLLISHSLGNFPTTPYFAFDPLVEPNTFFVVGTSTTKDLPLDVRTLSLTGKVRFAAQNLWASSTLLAPTLEMVPPSVEFQDTEQAVAEYSRSQASSESGYFPDFQPPYDAIVDAVSYARPALRVTSPASACGGGCVGRADYVARVDARHDTSPATASTHVVFSLINPLTDNTTPFCRSQLTGTPEVFPLEGVMTSVFNVKAANPARTRFEIGVSTTLAYGLWFKNTRGWVVALSKPGSALPADRALVTFNNTSKENRSLWTYQSSTCSGSGANPAIVRVHDVVLGPGQSDTFLITRSSVSTMVLGDTINDQGVFAEPNFWTFFGGKHVTITTVN